MNTAKKRTLGTVATYINGRAFKPSEWKTSGKPIIRIQNLTDSTAKYNFSDVEHEEKFLVTRGDLLFAWSASLGAHIWSGQDAWLNQHIFKVIPNDDMDKNYLYYFLLHVVAELYSKTHGSGMVHITKGPFWATEIPVPPLPEQERIVAKIEELFSQLDAAVAELKSVKEKLAIYRQAVMQNVIVQYTQDIPNVFIKDVCNEIKVGIVIKPSQYYTTPESGIKAFRSANVREFYIDDKDWVFLSKDGHLKNKRSEVHIGDILIVRSGYPGTACVVTEKFDGSNAIDVLIAVPNREKITPEYLCAYTNSPLGKKLVADKKRGVAQAHLNVGGYSKISIPIPEILVQNIIVEEIHQKVSICNNIEQTVDTALQQAAALRQSILKQAFEGKL